MHMVTMLHKKLLLLPLATIISYLLFASEWIVWRGDKGSNLGGVVLEKSDTSTPKGCQRRIDMSQALKCLGLPQNTTNIKYPNDPHDHFLELQNALQHYSMRHGLKPHKAPGYHGPWLENHWQKWGAKQAAKHHLTNENFCHTFGPYIPLLTAWTDVWVHQLYDDKLANILRQHLRKDVLYITVVQNDDGFPGDKREFAQIFQEYNILVLSSGGYGHVPVPLLKQREKIRRKKKVQDRRHLVSYTGSLGHAPQNLRKNMMDIVGMEQQHYYHGRHWRKIMRDSKFQLCPRGFGRTSYHVMESFQMGLIPIQVHVDGDIPWMPYGTFLGNVSFIMDLQGLPALFDQLAGIPDSEIEAMEAAIVRMIPEYFIYDGVLQQISTFMVSPHLSALECQALPKHAGTAKAKYFP